MSSDGRYGKMIAGRWGTGMVSGPCGCACGASAHQNERSDGRTRQLGRSRAVHAMEFYLACCRGTCGSACEQQWEDLTPAVAVEDRRRLQETGCQKQGRNS